MSVEFMVGDEQLSIKNNEKKKESFFGSRKSQAPLVQLTFSLDGLNEYQTAEITVEGHHIPVYVSTYSMSEKGVD